MRKSMKSARALLREARARDGITAHVHSLAHIPAAFRGRRLKQIRPVPTIDDQILSTPGVPDRSPFG